MFLIMQFEKSMFFKMGSSDVLTSPFALLLFVFNLQFEESVFLRRLVHSQSTFQRQLRRQIKKTKTPLLCYKSI
jgi:hypothetical protein